MEETETEKLGEPPENEVRIWGGGVILKKLDKLIAQNEDLINLLRHIENKIESTMTPENEEKLQRIKRRF